ncbi:hypothetical protein [Streptomyces sp. MH60]|uniref:hypothetical protein n=1 Tax=Streptomyces sp. MH60 TaxID=1940758 RepID=UPI000CEEC967|nr:hypothetical protein [Streptomyces sp. MH60]PPS89599.1 hypothetical protein BZZ08_01746 [Streptomyces sp. MH60]
MSMFQPNGWTEEMRYHTDAALISQRRSIASALRFELSMSPAQDVNRSGKIRAAADRSDRAADMLALRAEGMRDDVTPPRRPRFRVNA